MAEKKALEDDIKTKSELKTWKEHMEDGKKIVDSIKAETAEKYSDPKSKVPSLRAHKDMPFEMLKEALVSKAYLHDRDKNME